MSIAVEMKRLWLLLAVACSYTLIETFQLFALLQTPGARVHLLEVSGLTEGGDAQFQPRIPRSKTISLKDLSDLSSWPLVKTPRQEVFVTTMKAYGIKLDLTPVVLYDRSGLLFAAKAWWVFTVFGRDYVTVLNGGLPKWIREGYATSVGEPLGLLDPVLQGDLDYGYQLDPTRMWTVKDLTMLSGSLATPQQPVQLLDVRSKSDFDLSSVRGSINMPIDIVRRADGTLRTAIELTMIFQLYTVRLSNEVLTVVMGLNGVDSCMALLSLAVVGSDRSAMVDGGWQEYSQWLRNGTGAKAVTARAEMETRQGDWSWGLALGVLLLGGGVCCYGKKRALAQPRFAEKWL